MSSTIEEIQEEIVEEFEDFGDWEEKYSYIIEMGAEVPSLDAQFKTREYLVIGCQSQVWLVPDYNKEENKLYFKGDSDALIVKGLVNMLLRIYSGQSPEDILSSELSLFEKIGLKGQLSPSRANGLSSMVRDIKGYAARIVAGS